MKPQAPRMLASLWIAGVLSSAQSNTDPAIDVKLAAITDLTALGRTGTFPDGVNGCAMETTACNVGTAQVSWQAAMDPDHPFICFLLAREEDGRFEQISDRSYVKHGFFALSDDFCSSCSPTDGTLLGIGCSDTYASTNNGDNYWLGPPDEIDPWLGLWDPICSHFDRGEPPISPPFDCNGQRSLSHSQADALGPVGHRIQVKDADFDVPGAAFWFQGMYVIETEGESVRGDNSASRAFTPVWSGSRWNLNESGGLQYGSILQRWSGATLDSATNGGDDGRLYVAVKVTGPVTGFYHYEYAVHDRDNARGVGALRIPVCSSARVANLGFGDIDDDPSDDWTASVGAGEIVFSTAVNPLEWNSMFNFWFDSDAAPLAASVDLDQFAPGAGLASVAVGSRAPLGSFNEYLGAGCANDTPPELFAAGSPAQATLGNASFAIHSTGNDAFQPNALRYSIVPGTFTRFGCTFYLGNSLSSSFTVSSVTTDTSGLAVHPAQVPNDPALEGLEVNLQAVGRDPGNGTMFGSFELSDGLRVRVGSALSSCP